jgi:hypothetical protein
MFKISDIENKKNNSTIPETGGKKEPEKNTSDINRYTEYFRSAATKFKDQSDEFKKIVDNTPITIKFFNITVPFILCYLFTYTYYNLAGSIIFGILTFLAIGLLSKFFAILFILIYIISIYSTSTQINSYIGTPIQQTNIKKNNGPFDSMNDNGNKGLTISNKSLEKEKNVGYFSYSFWLYVNNQNDDKNWNTYRNSEWKSIFYRGSPINSTSDLTSITQFPGFWLTPKLNNLVLVFQQSETSTPIERIELSNIPLNTWLNITTVNEGRSVNIYLNGLLEKTVSLNQSSPDMNNSSLYLSYDSTPGGFPGNLAYLTYYNYPLESTDVNKIYLYYLPIINDYINKNKANDKNKYTISKLITDSDYVNK